MTFVVYGALVYYTYKVFNFEMGPAGVPTMRLSKLSTWHVRGRV